MSKGKFKILSFIIIALAAYLLFFSGLMPKKTRIVFVSYKNDAIKKLCEDFNNKNKDINLSYIAKSDYDGEKYILNNNADVWLPLDTSYIEYANRAYTSKNNNEELFSGLTNIAHSPLILVGARARFENASEMSITEIYDYVVNKKTWAAINGNSQWGSFRFACPDPYLDGIGAEFLSLLIYKYYDSTGNPKKELEAFDVQRDFVIQHLKPFVGNMEVHRKYVYSLLEEFADVERPRIDMGILYENEFFDSLPNYTEYWQKARVLYPSPTMSKQLLIVKFKSTLDNPKKTEAVKRFEKYLLSEAAQSSLLSLGYRPIRPSEATKRLLEEKYGNYGIKAELPKIENPAQPQAISEIQRIAEKYGARLR